VPFPRLSGFAPVVGVVSLLLSCIEATGSSIVVSTLKSSPTCCGEAIGIGDPNVKNQQAIRFVPFGAFLLDSIEFDLVRSFGSGAIVAQIYSESGGLPGTLLYSATASGPAPPQGGLFSIATMVPFVVQSGQAYWLTGTNIDPNSQSYWWYSDQTGWRAAQDVPGRPSSGFPNWGNANGGGPAGPGTNQSLVLSFEIAGTPVPEPSASAQALAALIVLQGWLSLQASKRGDTKQNGREP
jgi:hypothetical protein